MTAVKREVSMTPTPTPESDGSAASAIVKSTSPTSSASDDIDSKPVITTPSKKRGRPNADSTGKATKKNKGAQGESGESPARRTRQAWTPEEDAALFRHLLPICKEHIWTLAKNDPILSGRGGSMVKQRVNTIMTKLSK